jgi:hypothetical protein
MKANLVTLVLPPASWSLVAAVQPSSMLGIPSQHGGQLGKGPAGTISTMMTSQHQAHTTSSADHCWSGSGIRWANREIAGIVRLHAWLPGSPLGFQVFSVSGPSALRLPLTQPHPAPLLLNGPWGPGCPFPKHLQDIGPGGPR